MDEKQKLKLVNFVILCPQNQVTDPFFPLRDLLASFGHAHCVSLFPGFTAVVAEADDAFLNAGFVMGWAHFNKSYADSL